jgi:2,3,4,5-tetrahydropyridine-2,6-dicarboxylate N-succinyltransferase
MSKEFYGFGIRRKRANKTLDVLFFSISDNQNVQIDLDSKLNPLNGYVSLSESNYDTLPHVFVEHLKLNSLNSNYTINDIIYFSSHNLNQPVQNVEEAFFKLQLLSRRLVLPHSICLDKLFPTLHNIAWTTNGPILVEDLEIERLKTFASNTNFIVTHVDKFPYLVNYHVPSGVRIASGSQVRLGAYLGEGTTVMPAGYINFNAGTKGNAMIEGRVSAGVFVDTDSDIGGGASIMGTLSGGNNHVISVGKRCLIGANAGTGISLGDDCTIAAGVYIYAGMKISLYNEFKNPISLKNNSCNEGDNVTKALNLSGKSNLLFIQDSTTGKVICMPNKNSIQLNEELHSND